MIGSLVVIGAGGFGREVLDVVQALKDVGSGPELLGVVDDAPSSRNLELLAARGIRYMGTIDEWLHSGKLSGARYVVGIGDTVVRRKIVERVDRHGRPAATLVHPRAVVGTGYRFGAGTIICAGVVISTNVRCGKHVHLNAGSIIGHDSDLNSYVSVNPGAIVSGAVRIGPGALVGAGATVLQNLSIAANATVGAGACVIRDVSEGATVVGVPAK